MRQQRNSTYDCGLLPWFMNPQSTVLVGRDVLGPQVVDIRESQSRQRTEAEDIPNPFQSFVWHRAFQQQVQLRLCQRYLDIRLVDLHLVEAEGILLDPFVPDGIEDEVLQTAQQIDRSVVVAAVSRLHIGIQSIDVSIVERLQREVLLAIHLPDIFGHITQQAVVLVGRELCDTGADLLLPFFAVFREFGKEVSGGAARILEPLQQSGILPSRIRAS